MKIQKHWHVSNNNLYKNHLLKRLMDQLFLPNIKNVPLQILPQLMTLNRLYFDFRFMY